MPQALITVPKTAKRGEIIEIKTLIAHQMETGYRAGADGRVLPRNIITRFTCTYAGVEIFRAELFPAISANPFLTFTTVATESGKIVFSWKGDNGFEQTETVTITVA
ncbi:MAG TPA: thiosulfate oxidation carrier complex protein SoxZ [Alphaproteobacteria bacterium]|nr:thiosulfate oxidation carrier complex protein SoxZ [Alphaproteobacteria bacterium]